MITFARAATWPAARAPSVPAVYPKLAANKNFVSWQFVALTVLNGRNGMPPFGLPADEAGQIRATHLSDAQIAEWSIMCAAISTTGTRPK